MDPEPIDRVFAAALASLIEEVKRDRSILAAILCGSLSHDTVWAKSDIDLVLVTIDDRLVPAGGKALYADGVNIHALLVPRGEFRKMVEGSVRNSFMHSFLAKGRLLYTHDPTIADLCAAPPGDRRARHAAAAAPGGDARAAGALQGAQVADHARRPRLHRALDPLRGQRRWRGSRSSAAACWPTAR